MGGYGSGRACEHHITNECLPVDTSLLRKKKMLTGKLKQGADFTFTVVSEDMRGKVTEERHAYTCIVERYGGEGGTFRGWKAEGHVRLVYSVKHDDRLSACSLDIPLVVTHPNYGGVRWWYLAPCCGRRVRTLYIPLFYGSIELISPQCRACLGVNYASQRASYIERRKTYERYLLANYGYTWAFHEYHSLKEHYQEVTPYLAYLANWSQKQRDLEILKRFISCERLILKMHLYALRSLKSEEDRRLYLDCVKEEHSERYAQDLMHMAGISVETKRNVCELPPTELEDLYMQVAEEHEREQPAVTVMTPEQFGMYLKTLIERKREVENELKKMEQMQPAAV